MKLLVTLAVVVLPLLATIRPVAAQITPVFPNQPGQRGANDPDAQRKRDAAITVCVGTVRQERSAPKFDAYAAGSQLRVYGNPNEQQAFDRCMAQQGQSSR